MAATLASQLRQQLALVTIPTTDRLFTYRNWARSYSSTPKSAFQPTSEEQCVSILQLAALEGQTVRAVGSGHSPSDLPCTKGFMIRMDKLNKLIEVRLCEIPESFFLNCTAFSGPNLLTFSLRPSLSPRSDFFFFTFPSLSTPPSIMHIA